MLRTAAEGGTATRGDNEGARVSGRVTWVLGKRGEGGAEERGEGGGRKWGGNSVPWVPNPKLIPERDELVGASWDAHLCSEVSDACRLLIFLARSKRLFRRFPREKHQHID